MAPRVAPAPFDADNFSGSCTLAACSDWRFGVADSMSARAFTSPLQMPDIRLQASPPRPQRSINLFHFGGSPYRRLGHAANLFRSIRATKIAYELRRADQLKSLIWCPGPDLNRHGG